MEKVRKIVKNIQQWVLIFWIKSAEISVINKADFRGIFNPTSIKKGWIGNIPWVENGNLEYYEGKVLQVSTNKEYLLSLNVSTSGRIIKNKLLPTKPKVKGDNVMSLPNIEYFSEDGKGIAELASSSVEGYSKVVNAETCTNCKKCICRDWAASVTPEVAAAIIAIAESLKKASSSKKSLPHQRDNNDFIANEVSQEMDSPVYNTVLNTHVQHQKKKQQNPSTKKRVNKKGTKPKQNKTPSAQLRTSPPQVQLPGTSIAQPRTQCQIEPRAASSLNYLSTPSFVCCTSEQQSTLPPDSHCTYLNL